MAVRKMGQAGKVEEGGRSNSFSSLFRSAKISDAQFKRFSELIYQKVGIYLKPEKKELLNARLGKRLRACQISSFKEYYDFVVNDSSGNELVHLIDCVSTNFTSFFREHAHFDFLSAKALPAVIHNKKNKNDGIVIWSAACSSGEEPYTLGMVLEEYLIKNPGRQYGIIATDISTKVLSQAEKGVYAMDRVDKMSKDLLGKYFQKGVGKSGGLVKVKKNLREMISFMRLNLMDDFQWQRPIDIIFCRNVMIYFDKATQEKLINKFYRCLVPGGFLFIGHSESIASLHHYFKQVLAAVYQK